MEYPTSCLEQPLPQVVPMKNVFRPHQYLLLRDITPGSHVWMEGLDNKEG